LQQGTTLLIPVRLKLENDLLKSQHKSEIGVGGRHRKRSLQKSEAESVDFTGLSAHFWPSMASF
jgi:hypothetical protein